MSDGLSCGVKFVSSCTVAWFARALATAEELELPADIIGGSWGTPVIATMGWVPLCMCALKLDIHLSSIVSLRFGAEVITVGGRFDRSVDVWVTLKTVLPSGLVELTV